MDSIRHVALGCCVISTIAGMIRVFWPKNSFSTVINAVLVLYIITAGLQMIRGRGLGRSYKRIVPYVLGYGRQRARLYGIRPPTGAGNVGGRRAGSLETPGSTAWCRCGTGSAGWNSCAAATAHG